MLSKNKITCHIYTLSREKVPVVVPCRFEVKPINNTKIISKEFDEIITRTQNLSMRIIKLEMSMLLSEMTIDDINNNKITLCKQFFNKIKSNLDAFDLEVVEFDIRYLEHTQSSGRFVKINIE